MIKGFHKPTQAELDAFYERAMVDDMIQPYLSNTRYHEPKKVYESDWFGFMYISDCGKCLLNISCHRSIDLEFTIAIFSQNSYLAGKSLLILKKIISIYKPNYINSSVKQSNIKSLKSTRLLLGPEWGIEKGGCYSFKTGNREDLHYFRDTGIHVLSKLNNRKIMFP